MLNCSESEQALQKRFEEVYARVTSPTMQKIERQVCGCDFGGNSWTTREQAEVLIPHLKLGASSSLIDLGAGTGWPGIYIAKKSGCCTTLVDLPEIGLRIAKLRAEDEGISALIETRNADAADLPFPSARFDAISHSDLLCCLVRKRKVLEQCRRIIRVGGRMAFTVISLARGLSPSSHARALKNAPEFIEAETSYQVHLEKTGWAVARWFDLTNEYRDSCARQIKADDEYHAELGELLGPNEAAVRLKSWRSKLRAIDDGLFVRELFVCEPQHQFGPRT